ncbi:DNA-processing protein DprA [bacterium]|nr:DNA-processing protein DprA [bacterium]
MTDLDALLILNHLRVGPISARRLLEYFGSPSEIFRSLFSERQAPNIDFLSGDYVNRLLNWEKEVDLGKAWEILKREKIRVVTFYDRDYPELLKQIYDHPLLFYMKGSFSPADSEALAIVGSRDATEYGRHVAYRWAARIAGAGIPIISGLAAGVDTAAHEGALSAGGRTIALLGYGFGYVYPKENERLFDEIAEKGAVITEYAWRKALGKGSFPLRNRLIAGMAKATLVVESREKGGSLITAHYAAEYNRSVYAVPGPVNAPLSRGTNNLIREGATLVTAPEQLSDEFELMFQKPPQDLSLEGRRKATEEELEGMERAVFAALKEPLTPDALCEIIDESIDKISASLVSLEIKGYVLALPGRRYMRAEL